MGTFEGLRLYNTLTRRKEDFAPFDDANVRLYVCGPTVYDFAHIGNARPVIVFDVLFRLLRHLYGAGHVTYVRNITDIDDKINARAAGEYPDLPLNEAIRKVTETTGAQFHADVAALGCLAPTVEPRATEHVGEMVAMIRILVDKNHAYVAEGHVLFDVKSWHAGDGSPEYGKLSRRTLDDMIAGARVEVAPYKRDPMDFVLWKPSSAAEPGWESPWGRGRPGWHIECSAMADKWLWEQPGEQLSEEALRHPHRFDIHGGGIDLVFPHHENEIAQSRTAHGTDAMAQVWMHNGFLQVEGEKMAKSLGNFVTIRDALADWPGDVVRLNMLRTHYRQPIDWTLRGLEESRRVLDRWYAVAGDAHAATGDNPMIAGERGILESLLDDLNTPDAISRLHAFDDDVEGDETGDEHAMFKGALNLLGLMQASREDWQAWRPSDFSVDEDAVDGLIAARAAARAERDFAEADRIRDKLAGMGIALNDSKDPETGELVTTWEVKR